MATVAAIKEPAFLYPTSHRFPFSEVIEHIVRALEDRNWNIPGIAVEFRVYGSGNAKQRIVSSITGEDFRIVLNANSSATLNIPQKELHVYDNESGPTFYTYVGDDWKNDSGAFTNSSKLASKLNGERRTYLKYKGACHCADLRYEHSHWGQRSPLLTHANDLGHEYELKKGEATSYLTHEVMQEFTDWLMSEVLPRITAHPSQERIDSFTEERTPFPEGIGPIFTFGKRTDARRIKTGQTDMSRLEPREQYALACNGYRLLLPSVRNDGSVPEAAYSNFLWAGLGIIEEGMNITSLKVPGSYHWNNRETAAFKISPNRANGVFVADNHPYDLDRKKDDTRAELARARTLVPISEYIPGSFTDPVILINRELDFDEVEVVIEPPRY